MNVEDFIINNEVLVVHPLTGNETEKTVLSKLIMTVTMTKIMVLTL